MTGTAQLNQTMINFENRVAQYIEDNLQYHVLYRATPIFEGDNLLANGIQLESMSVEERKKAKNVCFNVYIYNVQPRDLHRLCNWRKL